MAFTLRQLQYFRALSEHRNFGRAAGAVNVSQPALSVQIRALEEEMGGALVERRARDVVLTPRGRQVQALVGDVLGAVEKLEHVTSDPGAGRRSLRLGLIPTIAPYLLPGVLSALRAGDLSLNVQVREARTAQLLTELLAGDLDAAVMAVPGNAAGVEEAALFSDRFLLAGSRARLDDLHRCRKSICPQDLDPTHLLLLEDGHCLTDQALDVCGVERNGPGINMGASSLATLSRLVAEGFGLTLMPELAVFDETRAAPNLCLHRFDTPQPARTIGLVRRASTPGDGWFDDLARLVRDVGTGIVAQARNET